MTYHARVIELDKRLRSVARSGAIPYEERIICSNPAFFSDHEITKSLGRSIPGQEQEAER
jgi:hypothetical protein